MSTNKEMRANRASNANRSLVVLAASVAPGSLREKSKQAVVHKEIQFQAVKTAIKGIQARRRRAKTIRGQVNKLRLVAAASLATAGA